MRAGELLTRATIWLALIGYALGAVLLLLARPRAPRLHLARWVWTIGCAFFVAHVLCAFAFHHGWSHAAAYRETARQTAEMTGFDSGAGLWLNYLFGVAWIADALAWWRNQDGPSHRPPWLTRLWQGFFFFMVFNGTVVFGKGPVRWLGGAICGALAWAWWQGRIKRSTTP